MPITRAYEFYRVLIFTGIGMFLIAMGSPLYSAIGAGFMCIAIIMHATTIARWQTEDLKKEMVKE